MSRFYVSAAAAVLLLCVGGSAQATTTPNPYSAQSHQPTATDKARIQAAFQGGMNKLQTGDIKGAHADFKSVIDDPIFSLMPGSARYGLYVLISFTEETAYAAYDDLQKASEAAPEMRDGMYWQRAAQVAVWRRDTSGAIDALLTVARVSPDVLLKTDERLIWQVLTQSRSKPGGQADRQKLLEALHAANYTPPDSFLDAEDFWRDLFEIYAETGQDDKARALAPSLKASLSLMETAIDRRYSRFMAPDPDHTAFKAAQIAGIARDRDKVSSHPDQIKPVQLLAYDLSSAGQSDEAVAIMDAAIARITAAPKDKPAFSDLEENYPWLTMTRSIVLLRMGHWNEAVAAQIKSRDDAVAAGYDRVSQPVNLGDIYYMVGKPQLALDAVKELKDDDSSDYGRMAVAEVRACAYQQLGDPRLKATLDYMRAHANDGYGPYRTALECTGDVEGLAKLLIARLDNPEYRSSALMDIQTYLPFTNPTPVQARMTTVMTAAVARPDVQAAATKYGTIASWPTFNRGN